MSREKIKTPISKYYILGGKGRGLKSRPVVKEVVRWNKNFEEKLKIGEESR